MALNKNKNVILTPNTRVILTPNTHVILTPKAEGSRPKFSHWCHAATIGAILLFTALLMACGDDDSDFASLPSDDSSSSVCEDCDDASSSSVTPKSSDSETSVSSSSMVSANSSSVTLISSSVILSGDSHEGSSSIDSSNSSASEKSSSSVESSSSVVQSSSSVPLSSSSGEASSSSTDSSNSSSSDSEESSSSVGEAGSSSSFVELNCSALLEEEREKDRWNWDIPKECRFNPDIAYGSMTDSRDGQTYKIVKIGDQTWMAENLNFDPGQGGSDNAKYDWSWCNEEPKNCAVAGRLYTWAAAIDSVKLATDADNPQDCGYGKTCTIPAKVQGVCPEGWHLPTKAEWNTLSTEVGESTAGKILKSQTGWYHNGNGTDGVGFSALPAGRVYDGNFGVAGISAFFWSSTEDDDDGAYCLFLDYDGGFANLSFRSKVNAYSVRCLKD